MELGVDVGQQEGALARLGEHQGHPATLVTTREWARADSTHPGGRV